MEIATRHPKASVLAEWVRLGKEMARLQDYLAEQRKNREKPILETKKPTVQESV